MSLLYTYVGMRDAVGQNSCVPDDVAESAGGLHSQLKADQEVCYLEENI